MAEQLEKDLWRLNIPLVGNPLKNLNSYLITGERNLLIDTGFRQQPCREGMERELAEAGADLDRTDIFLTHLHSDHTGLAPDLVRPGCRIYMGGGDCARMQKYRDPEMWRTTYRRYELDGFTAEEMDTLWETNPAKAAAPALYEGYVCLEDGDTLTVGDRTLRCILTPGHTPGHMCLYEPEAKWLFSGDHVLFHITPNICRWEGVADSLGDYLKSLDRVRDLTVERLLPAHRAETGVLMDRIDELKTHHDRRLAGALAIVAAQPGLTAYEIAGSMAWSIRCRNWEEFPLTQKYFAVGEALAHLDALEARGQVTHRMENGKNRYYIVTNGGEN